MTTALATRTEASDLAASNGFNDSKIDLLKRTICRGATNDELELFVHACKRTGLDPFMKQIHAVKRKQKNERGEWVEVMSIQCGIDGYRLIADRTDRYMPGREPAFTYDDNGNVMTATAYVKKLGKDGQWHEIGATAHWSEYVSLTRDGNPTRMWGDKPHIMLAKCAEALALRRAFPAELSGVYTREEMEQADNATPVAQRPRLPEPPADPDAHDPAPEADVDDPNANFLYTLDQSFENAGWTEAERENYCKLVLSKAKVGELTALTFDQRGKLVNAIRSGAIKPHREQAPQPAAPAAAAPNGAQDGGEEPQTPTIPPHGRSDAAWIDEVVLMHKPAALTKKQACAEFHKRHAPHSWDAVDAATQDKLYAALLDGSVWGAAK